MDVPLFCNKQPVPLDDHLEHAEVAWADIGIRSHFRDLGGEPISDAAMRGLDLQNGIGYESEFDCDGLHDD